LKVSDSDGILGKIFAINPHWGKRAIFGDQKHIILKDFISISLYLPIYDEETTSIKPFRATLKFLIYLFIITSAGLKVSLKQNTQ